MINGIHLMLGGLVVGIAYLVFLGWFLMKEDN